MSRPITAGLDRLANWVKEHSDVDRPFRLCRVVDSQLWATEGPSFVGVEWDGVTRQAVYRDGPRPLDGQYLQVVQMNHRPNSALLALPLPQQYRRRLPFIYATYDTSGLLSPNDDTWSIIAGRKDNGHWVKRSNNPVSASVFSAFGVGSRFRMKMRAVDTSDQFDLPFPATSTSVPYALFWGYPDFQGGEASIPNVANAFETTDGGETWTPHVRTGVVDFVDRYFLLAGGGAELWDINSGAHPGVGFTPQDKGYYQITGAPTALKVLNSINWNAGVGSEQHFYLILANHTQYWVLHLKRPSIVQPTPAANQYELASTLGPFGLPGGATLADMIQYRGYNDGAGPGINSSLTGSFVVWRMGPNKQTYKAFWNQLISGGGWTSYTGTVVPDGADPIWSSGSVPVAYEHAVNPSAPWVGYHFGTGSAPPEIDPHRMVDGTEQAFRSRLAPGEYAPFYSQFGLGDFAFTEQYIKPDLTTARTIRTAYAVVGPPQHGGGTWAYDFPNGARGPKLIAAISDPTLGGHVVIEDSEYMDEDLGNRYALYPFARTSATPNTGGVDWWEGFASGEVG